MDGVRYWLGHMNCYWVGLRYFHWEGDFDRDDFFYFVGHWFFYDHFVWSGHMDGVGPVYRHWMGYFDDVWDLLFYLDWVGLWHCNGDCPGDSNSGD